MKRNTYDILARVVPFAIYMAFVAALEIPTYLGGEPPSQTTIVLLYPAKILLVALALLAFRKSYTDFDWYSLRNARHSALSIGTGVIVFALWINLDMPFAIQGELTSYDPTEAFGGTTLLFLIASRILGAVVCVPIMEELFWRSFLARYLVGKDFMAVRAGTFTLFSFAVTSVLFGLEHQLYLAGIIAGAAYNLVYMQTKSLAHCIISHAVTNAILAIYVLVTRSWYFW